MFVQLLTYNKVQYNTFSHKIRKRNMRSEINCIFIKMMTNIRQMSFNYEQQVSAIMKKIIELKKQQNADPRNIQILQKLKQCKQRLFILKEQVKTDNQAHQNLYETCRKRVHMDHRLFPHQQKSQSENHTGQTQAKNDEKGDAKANGNIGVSKQNTNQQIDQQNQRISEELQSNIYFQRDVLHYLEEVYEPQKVQEYFNSLKSHSNLKNAALYFQPELSILKRGLQILQQIKKNKINELAKWCYQHSHLLKKLNSSLQFNLLACQFIMMISQKKRQAKIDAVQYMRNKLHKLYLSQDDKMEISKLTMLILFIKDDCQQNQFNNHHKVKICSKKTSKITRARRKNRKNNMNNEDEHNSSSSLSGEDISSLIDYPIQSAISSNSQISTLKRQWTYQLSNKRPQSLPISLKNQQQSQKMQQLDDNMQNSCQNHANAVQTLQSDIKVVSNQYSKHKSKIISKNDVNIRLKIRQINKDGGLMKRCKNNGFDKYLKQARSLFIEAFTSIYRIPLQSNLDSTIATGIKILKTKYCFTQQNSNLLLFKDEYLHKDKICNNNRNCPVCTPEIRSIAETFPMISCQQTALICRINGSLMNQQDNYPLILPNGQIYSFSGLQMMIKNGKYHCPITNRLFKKDTCRRVFII